MELIRMDDYAIIGIEERSGKLIEKLLKKKIILTIVNGIKDIEILKEFGRIA